MYSFVVDCWSYMWRVGGINYCSFRPHWARPCPRWAIFSSPRVPVAVWVATLLPCVDWLLIISLFWPQISYDLLDLSSYCDICGTFLLLLLHHKELPAFVEFTFCLNRVGLTGLARLCAAIGSFVVCLPHLLRSSKYRRGESLAQP